MAVITGGNVSAKGVVTDGVRPTIYQTNGVPTDATVSSGFTASNGDLAVNVANGQMYERQGGVWTRIDTV